MDDLSGLTTVQLIEEHNRLVGSEEKHLKAWKREKGELVALVQAMRDEDRRRRGSRTIKVAAYELLLATDYEDHTQRRVGFSYDEILRRLRAEFPECDTTDKCLRWYAVKLNEDGAKLPWRPRRPPKRRKKADGEGKGPDGASAG